MKIVVTGGAGHIGSALVEYLYQVGHDVLCLDVRKPRYTADVPWKFVELQNRAALQPLLEGVDAVAHLGELSNVHKDTPLNVFARNTAISGTVFQTAADMGVKRVVYTSSCQVYSVFGDGREAQAPSVVPFDERYPLSPRNAYGASKVANEAFAAMTCATTDISIAALRLPMVSDNGRWWNRARFRERPIEEVQEYGTYLMLDDAVTLMTRMLETQRPGFEAYHAAARDNLSQFTISELAAHHGYSGTAIPADARNLFDCRKLLAHFGWQAQQTFD